MGIKFKKNVRTNGIVEYFHDKDRRSPDNWVNDTLYDRAIWLEDITNFELEAYSPEGKLIHLKEEIKIRISITQNEIFKIGELLWMAKNICQEEKLGFKDWIKDNFDFSYETANNFMNVFKQCFAHRSIAYKLPVSILYKISSPGFSDTLRDYLFEHGNLEKITNGKFKNLTEKFKAGGLEAIENDLEEIRTGELTLRQINYTVDIYELSLRTLDDLKNKIECRGGSVHRRIVEFKTQVESQTELASEINTKLFESVDIAFKTMETALSESMKLINEYLEKTREKM